MNSLFSASAVWLLAQAAPASGGEPTSLIQIVFSGGWIGISVILLLILMSIAAMALSVEHLMTIRPSVLMPPGLADHVQQRLAQGDVAAARQICEANPSFLGFVIENALTDVEGGWTAVEKALEDSAADQSARLYRKIEYLSVIANLATMLGLLGTVIGLIMAFHEVAQTQGAARPSQLASGIYHALVSTVAGLVIAIPSLGAFAVFRNRVDQLSAETAYAAQHAIMPVKRALSSRRPGGIAPPPTPPGVR